jgi:alkylation response protein AidB-like acyl-CoA dehydrogenase
VTLIDTTTVVHDALTAVVEDLQQTPRADVDAWGLIYDAGLSRVDFPVGFGGLGAAPELQDVVDAELARIGVPSNYKAHAGGIAIVAPVLANFGNDEQRHRFLRRVFTCEDMWCQLFSEPDAGSDLANLRTRAVRDGDGWVVNGHKVWNTMAHIAKWGILLARTSDAPRHKGITCFIVDMEVPGVEVRPLRQMTGDAEFNEVFLTDVVVPDDRRVGDVDGGWAVAMGTLMFERFGVNQLLDNTLPALDHVLPVWHRLPAEARTPGARDRLLRLYVESKVCDLFRRRVAAQIEMGVPGPEGSLVKLLSNEINMAIYDMGVDLLGAEGMLYGDYAMRRPASWFEVGIPTGDLPRAFLRSRANSIEAGTSEVQRNTIAERILGMPREPRG